MQNEREYSTLFYYKETILMVELLRNQIGNSLNVICVVSNLAILKSFCNDIEKISKNQQV